MSIFKKLLFSTRVSAGINQTNISLISMFTKYFIDSINNQSITLKYTHRFDFMRN